MTKELDKTGKAIGLSLIANIFLEKAGDILKKDNNFYKQKNKQVLNQLLELNLPIIKSRELLYNLIVSDKNLKAYEEKTGLQLDKEVVEDNFNSEIKLIANLVYLYLSVKNDTQLIDLYVVSEEMVNRRRIYTQNDLLHKLELAVKDFCNYTEIDKSKLEKYL